MKQLKALKRHPYGGKYHNVGDIYTVTDAHATALIVTRNSELYEEPVKEEPKPKRTYTRRNQTKRTYDRKDMQAD